MGTYVFATCHAGLEAWLKADVQRQRPAWRVAVSHPGFTTWHTGDDEALPLPWRAPLSTFAHAFGVCWGQARDLQQLIMWGAQLSAQHRALRLHVFARAGVKVPKKSIAGLHSALHAAMPHAFVDMPGPAQPGEGVFDVVAVDHGPNGTVWWGGWHVHTDAHAPWPGGAWPIQTPPEAPARAYQKFATALAWARLPIRPGDNALELGAAPGGAAHAMLERGLDVWGVDPVAMDPSVAAFAEARGRTFVHLRKAAGEVRPSDLPSAVHWLVGDMNVAAPIAWRYARRLLPDLGALRGVVLTLKLNDLASVARLPALLAEIMSGGAFKSLKAAQLHPYRREVLAVGLTGRDAPA